MVTVQTIEDGELKGFTNTLLEFYNLDEDGSLMPYLYEEDVAGGDVELRAFPKGEDSSDRGPVEGIIFEVIVSKEASWHENLSAYGRANLSNGGPIYEALHEEIQDAVEAATGCHVDLVAEKGSRAFTGEIEF